MLFCFVRGVFYKLLKMPFRPSATGCEGLVHLPGYLKAVWAVTRAGARHGRRGVNPFTWVPEGSLVGLF